MSILVIATVLGYALWPLFSVPNTYYPMTADGMGHLTKIEYMANCLKELHWPSWFPDWYNGATVIQYYPPLAYILLVPIQMVFNNVLITFYVFAYFSLFIGAIGVFKICQQYVGQWMGLLGGILYILQPFLMGLICTHGVIAQGPIIALSPWLLYFTLRYLETTSRGKWLIISLITALLILSHAMHAFLVALGTGLIVIIMYLLRSINFSVLLTWCLAIGFGGGLVSFWWLPGVTQLETPGVPYVLKESIGNWTANFNWFNPLLKGENFIL